MNNNKPLSPHLSIYRWQINSILSILHRISGAFLHIVLIIFAWLFALNIFYPESKYLIVINELLLSKIGKFFICGISFMLYFHILNGIRHLAWDCGLGFKIPTMKMTSIIVLSGASFFTMLTIYILYFN